MAYYTFKGPGKKQNHNKYSVFNRLRLIQSIFNHVFGFTKKDRCTYMFFLFISTLMLKTGLPKVVISLEPPLQCIVNISFLPFKLYWTSFYTSYNKQNMDIFYLESRKWSSSHGFCIIIVVKTRHFGSYKQSKIRGTQLKGRYSAVKFSQLSWEGQYKQCVCTVRFQD